MVSALFSGSSGPGSSPGRGHCVVLTLYPTSANPAWLVRSSPDRAVRVRALAGDIVLC